MTLLVGCCTKLLQRRPVTFHVMACCRLVRARGYFSVSEEILMSHPEISFQLVRYTPP